ncbi:hypothetical protein CC79DRAFT_666226 [Sarocladium strictum]
MDRLDDPSSRLSQSIFRVCSRDAVVGAVLSITGCLAESSSGGCCASWSRLLLRREREGPVASHVPAQRSLGGSESARTWKFPSPGLAAHSARGLHELQTRESCFLRTLYAGFGYAETDPCDIVAEQR